MPCHFLSELVRAMRAEGQDVLDEELVIGEVGLESRLLVLNSEAAELGRRPVEHDRRALRMKRAVREEGVVCSVIDAARIEPVISRPDPPLGEELPNALNVEAVLVGAIAACLRQAQSAVRVVGKVAVLSAPEVLALELEVRIERIAVGRPLPHEISDRELRPSREGEISDIAGEVRLREVAVGCSGLQIRKPRAPAVAGADVAASVRVDVPVADPVLVAIVPRKRLTAADLAAEFEEQIRRRDPFHLQAVVLVLAAEECL